MRTRLLCYGLAVAFTLYLFACCAGCDSPLQSKESDSYPEDASVKRSAPPIQSKTPSVSVISPSDRSVQFRTRANKPQLDDSSKKLSRDLFLLGVTVIATVISALFGVIAVVITLITLLFVMIDTLIKVRIKSTKDEQNKLVQRVNELEKMVSDQRNTTTRPREQELLIRELFRVFHAEILRDLQSRDTQEHTSFLPFN